MKNVANLNNKAFTLIELLVVVLIIGILAAIAVPKYQLAVEKSIMQEAIINLKAIAKANDVFYLQNGRYANSYEMDKLDISIPGEINTSYGLNRIATKYFLYSPGSDTPGAFKALAHRLPIDIESKYFLVILPNNDIRCNIYNTGTPSNEQRKLCYQINAYGHL